MVLGVEKRHYVEYGPRTDGKGYDITCSCGWRENKLPKPVAIGTIHLHLVTESLSSMGIEV
jgi:hypothetical protein